MRIRPYKACDAKYIVKWVTDERTLYQWSADRINQFPLTEEILNQYYDAEAQNDSIFEFTATDDENIPVGHFFIRYIDKDTVRLGFVIVDPAIRGKGYGKQMVLLAKEYAFRFLNAKKAGLGVFANNPKALHCYEAAGFQIIKEANNYSITIQGEEWKCIELDCTDDVT